MLYHGQAVKTITGQCLQVIELKIHFNWLFEVEFNIIGLKIDHGTLKKLKGLDHG